MKQKKIDMVCRFCKRILPNKDWRTDKGKRCIWCDGDYHKSKEKR